MEPEEPYVKIPLSIIKSVQPLINCLSSIVPLTDNQIKADSFTNNLNVNNQTKNNNSIKKQTVPRKRKTGQAAVITDDKYHNALKADVEAAEEAANLKKRKKEDAQKKKEEAQNKKMLKAKSNIQVPAENQKDLTVQTVPQSNLFYPVQQFAQEPLALKNTHLQTITNVKSTRKRQAVKKILGLPSNYMFQSLNKSIDSPILTAPTVINSEPKNNYQFMQQYSSKASNQHFLNSTNEVYKIQNVPSNKIDFIQQPKLQRVNILNGVPNYVFVNEDKSLDLSTIDSSSTPIVFN